jgi:predicted RNA-binding protein with PUA-like domain
MSRQYWLLKTEPDSYNFEDLKRDKVTAWTGVRNYQARNYLRDSMQPGDKALFYHSGDERAIVGSCEIVSKSFGDHTAMDPKDSHFDPKSTPENPIWYAVEVRYLKPIDPPLTLTEAKKRKGLEKMVLLQKGSRLSIQPVTEKEWKIITGE